MWKEFKEFAVKGNAVDLAVGVIIGAAFGAIVTSLVKDILMPPLGLLTGGLDFSNKFIVLKARPDGATNFATPADAVKAGAITWNYGNFITLVINFLIVAFCIFLVVQSGEQNEEAGAERRAGFERLPVLRDDDSDQGDALPALHFGNGRHARALNAAASIGGNSQDALRRAEPRCGSRSSLPSPRPPPRAKTPAESSSVPCCTKAGSFSRKPAPSVIAPGRMMMADDLNRDPRSPRRNGHDENEIRRVLHESRSEIKRSLRRRS